MSPVGPVGGSDTGPPSIAAGWRGFTRTLQHTVPRGLTTSRKIRRQVNAQIARAARR